MTLPEDQIAALEIRIVCVGFDDFTERVFLHVRIAQDLATCDPHRKLDKAGTIDPKA